MNKKEFRSCQVQYVNFKNLNKICYKSGMRFRITFNNVLDSIFSMQNLNNSVDMAGYFWYNK